MGVGGGAHSALAQVFGDGGQSGRQIVDLVAQGFELFVDVIRNLAHINQEFVFGVAGRHCPSRGLRAVPVHSGRRKRAGGGGVARPRVLFSVRAARGV